MWYPKLSPGFSYTAGPRDSVYVKTLAVDVIDFLFTIFYMSSSMFVHVNIGTPWRF